MRKMAVMFQFHNGTIHTAIQYSISIEESCFNSTTVQLILGDSIQLKSATNKFQFHNGTINTLKRSTKRIFDT